MKNNSNDNTPPTPTSPAAIQPAAMKASSAAAYLDMTTAAFRRAVKMDALPKPIKVTERIERWRKVDLDRWLASFNGGNGIDPDDAWSQALAA